jgi:hypothetical protein
MKPGKISTLALLIGSFLVSAGLKAAPCAASDTVLCLSAQRFSVEVRWRDFAGNTGSGRGVRLTPDTGYFWFFSDNNVELVVKVLDARGFNGHFWVFFGALSNVEYTLTVTDTATGATKAYQNPSGQFASVGDTAAFTGMAATHETAVADGTAMTPGSLDAIQKFIEAAEVKSASQASGRRAAAFTPCPGTPRILSLSNCRFQLEVEWTDPQGRTGPGQAVQLTNDTGYFWFFSDNNVELIVKVLDARSFNGHFWVFYGALSNVQYTITLKDSVTGSYKRYDNASGTFASVGDTSALRGGVSVAPVVDPAHAASANLDEKGGSVTATGADGTVFTLQIPAESLQRPETVTLTPVARIDRFPFSGGLAAGVEIEPAGLDLLVPASLTIRPPSAPPVNRTLPYSYGRGGEDFILYPRAVDISSIRLPLVRLGGYGVGQGDSAEGISQADKLPTGPLAPYLQRYAREVLRRVLGQINQAELLARGIQIYREAFGQLVAPFLDVASSGVTATSMKEEKCPIGDKNFQQALESMFGIIRQKQMLGIDDPDHAEESNGINEALELLRICMQESFDRCVSRTDPYEALLMVQIAVQLERLGEEDPRLTTFIQDGLLERCLRFELDFESKIVLVDSSPDAGGTIRMKYRSAHVPLRFSYAGNFYANRSIWEGGCSLQPEVATLELSSGFGDCTFTADGGKGWFDAAAAWIGVLEDPTKSAVTLFYDPGNPQGTAILSCPDEAPIDLHIFQWRAQYVDLHQNEAVPLQEAPGFIAKSWEQLRFGPGPSQNGEFFAKKSYERGPIVVRPNFTVTEETWFFLKHTPDKPMPECP